MNILRKLVPPGCIFAIFLLFSLLGEGMLDLMASRTSESVLHVLSYTIHIGLVLSAAFLLTAAMNVIVWDGFIARVLGTAVPRLIKDLSAVAIFIISLTVIVGVIFERSVTGIWAASSAIGFVLGFALRGLILDVFTGLAINVERSYKIGDWIHLHSRDDIEFIGCIEEINWRTTRIKTTDNNIIVVPNSLIGQSIVTNFSAPNTLSRLDLLFYLDFSVPTERALRVLLAGVMAAVGSEGIEAVPEPKVKVNAITKHGIEYKIRYWIYPEKTSPNRARHLVLQQTLHNLHTAGLSLAYPKLDVFHASMPSRQLRTHVREDRASILASIDLFSDLPPEALDLLATKIALVTFEASERVVTIGDEGDSMFIIIEGLLDVYLPNSPGPGPKMVKIGHLSAGQFFGEMALLTGKPRSATVVAATDVVAYQITHEHMMPLFDTYPEVLETISKVVAARQAQQAHLHETLQPPSPEITQTLTEEVLHSIKMFFSHLKEVMASHRRVH